MTEKFNSAQTGRNFENYSGGTARRGSRLFFKGGWRDQWLTLQMHFVSLVEWNGD